MAARCRRAVGDRFEHAIAFERVRQLTYERGWIQERLAEAAELNVIQLSNIARGANERKLTAILELAKALSAGPERLLL